MSPDQKAIILFLHEKGHATAEEIRKGVGLNEGSGVTDLLDALGQAGAIVNSPRHGSLVLSSHGHWLAGELASGVFSSKVSKAAPPPSEPSIRAPTPSSLGIESAPPPSDACPVAPSSGGKPPQRAEGCADAIDRCCHGTRAFAFNTTEPHYSYTPLDGYRFSFTMCHCLLGKDHPSGRDGRSARPARDPAHISTLVLESLKGMAEKLEEVAQSQARDAEAIRHVMNLVDKESAGDG